MLSTRRHSKIGFWFLRDMTDVYDMYMLSFTDVVQMHEGRPLLSSADFSIYSYRQSFHMQVGICIGISVVVVIFRAAAISGVQPFIWLLRRCGCSKKIEDDEIRKPIDAALSLFFIEVPFLILRFMASWNYGVPVSVMAVKNSLGIFEDLYLLGLGQGFVKGARPRGLALFFRALPDEQAVPEAEAEHEPKAEPVGRPASPLATGEGALGAPRSPVHGILLPEGYKHPGDIRDCAV